MFEPLIALIKNLGKRRVNVLHFQLLPSNVISSDDTRMDNK